jgi:topoisomerase IA-like protein
MPSTGLLWRFSRTVDQWSRVYAPTIDAPTTRAGERDAEAARASLTSARTATRNLDLQLAIATLRLPAPAEIGTNPNDSGSVWPQQGGPS